VSATQPWGAGKARHPFKSWISSTDLMVIAKPVSAPATATLDGAGTTTAIFY
jgi:hypothetical protein